MSCETVGPGIGVLRSSRHFWEHMEINGDVRGNDSYQVVLVHTETHINNCPSDVNGRPFWLLVCMTGKPHIVEIPAIVVPEEVYSTCEVIDSRRVVLDRYRGSKGRLEYCPSFVTLRELLELGRKWKRRTWIVSGIGCEEGCVVLQIHTVPDDAEDISACKTA